MADLFEGVIIGAVIALIVLAVVVEILALGTRHRG